MIVLRQHLVDYHRESPTPALDYGSEYFLLGVYWSTPTDAAPSCVTNTAIFGQVRTTFPSHQAYDLQSLKIMQPRIDQVMSGFPRLFTDIPYIAQCIGAARRSRRPGYLSKASFLTSTQTVITTGAVKTPTPPPATVAQPQVENSKTDFGCSWTFDRASTATNQYRTWNPKIGTASSADI
jgi:hypothetical protein